MCKSYDLVRISVTCCAELDKNQNKRAGTVISVPTWPYLQHPSPQLDIKPANNPTNMTSALTSTPADSTVDRRQVSAGALQSQRPLCFSLCFSFLSSDGQTGADTGSDALRNLLRQSPGRRAGTVRNFSNDRWTFVFSLTRGLIFSFSSSKRQTLPISKVISKHKTLLPHP